MLNLSHNISGSEIPENFDDESNSDKTRVVEHVLSNKERVVECLRDAGGDSLTVFEVVETTGVGRKSVERILKTLSSVDLETREVFEDENARGSYFLTEPMLDRLAIGF
jgi:DNA-directed RNA polymerase alpha subunit